MPDREKIIGHLNDCMEASRRDNTWVFVRKDIVEDALELLKEQEAVEHEWIYKHDNLWYCSRCGEFIYSSTDEDLAFHHVYCSRCGAKMKQEGR